MIDYFAIALTHGLIALAAWRLLSRDDLDEDVAEGAERPEVKPWLKNRANHAGDHTPEAGQSDA